MTGEKCGKVSLFHNWPWSYWIAKMARYHILMIAHAVFWWKKMNRYHPSLICLVIIWWKRCHILIGWDRWHSAILLWLAMLSSHMNDGMVLPSFPMWFTVTAWLVV